MIEEFRSQAMVSSHNFRTVLTKHQQSPSGDTVLIYGVTGVTETDQTRRFIHLTHIYLQIPCVTLLPPFKKANQICPC